MNIAYLFLSNRKKTKQNVTTKLGVQGDSLCLVTDMAPVKWCTVCWTASISVCYNSQTWCHTIQYSDHMVWLPFRYRISNCTNLCRPEPNRTRHRIFAFVSLLFGNL